MTAEIIAKDLKAEMDEVREFADRSADIDPIDEAGPHRERRDQRKFRRWPPQSSHRESRGSSASPAGRERA